MASKGSIWASIGLRTAEFKKSLLDLQVRSKSMGSSLKKGLSGLNPLTLGVAAGFATIGGAVASAVSVVNDFSKAQSEVEAVLGELGTNTAMAKLSSQAKQLGSSTKFTATEVSNLQTELAKLGFRPEEIEKMAESTLHAASALGSELGEQASLTGATLKSFNLDAGEATRVNDVLAKAASSSALDFSKLSTALPIVGATAKTAGVSLERTTALLGTLSDRGIDASSSATALRNIFLELSKKGLTFEEAMQKINTSTDKNATAMDLFGKRGATVGVILSETGGDVAELTKKLEEADGAAKGMAETMEDNLIGDMTKAQSAWEGFILSIEDGEGVISQAVRGMTQSFTALLGRITAFTSGGLDGYGLEVASSARNMDKEIKGLGVTMGDMTKAAENNTVMFNQMTGLFKAGKMDAEKYAKGVKALAGGWQAMTAEEKHANRVAADRAEMKLDMQLTEEEKAAFRTAGAVKELTKEQQKAAFEAKKLANSLDDFITVDNNKFKTGVKSAIDEIKKQVDKAKDEAEGDNKPTLTEILLGTGKKPKADGVPKLKIPIYPEIQPLPPEQGRKVTGDMIKLGEDAGRALSSSIQGAMGAGLSSIGQNIGNMIGGGSAELKQRLKSLKEELKGVDSGSEEFKRIQEEIKATREQMNGFGGGIANMGATLIGGFSNLLKSFGEQMIQLGLGMLALKAALALGPLGAGLAIAGGVALIAMASAIQSSLANSSTTAFAKGGIVGSPTMGLVGEYAGARHNPEVIAPLDKLQSMLGGDSGMNEIKVTGQLVGRGKDMVAIINQAVKVSKYSS
jgi:hypothetical protein